MQGLDSLKLMLSCIAEKQALSSVSVRSSAFSFLLVLSFVFAQAVSLSHSHEGDLRDQVDCEICLKVSADDDVLLGKTELVTGIYPSRFDQTSLAAAISVAVPTATARAPPHA